MAEFTHDDIKNRIRDILQADTTNLYDASGEGTKTKLVEIVTGYPNQKQQGKTLHGRKFPYAFIINANPFEKIISKGSEVAGLPKALEHIIQYDIVFGVVHDTAKDAELQLDTFQQTILDNLEQDPQLVGAGSALVDTSKPVSVRPYQPELLGTEKQDRVITLKVFKTSTQ